MNEEIKPVKIPNTGQEKFRPVLLSVLCFFSFVFFAVLSVLFFIGLFYSGWITSVSNQYIPHEAVSKSHIFIILLAGFLLHFMAFTGSVLIWNLHKTGYYILGFSCLIIAGYQTLQPQITVTTTAIYIVLLLLFGLFFRRLQ